MDKNERCKVKGRAGFKTGALAGVIIGVLLGVLTYQAGVGYACPSRNCVGSAEVTPVADREYFQAARDVLAGAEETIHIVSFEVKYYRSYPDSLQNQLVRELIYARERGVEVRVIVDEFSESDNAYDLLKANGVDIRHDGKETTTHCKLIIVDGKVVLLGSTNLSYYGLEKNHEANVKIVDRRTAEYYEEYFRQLWGE
ncbi:MAG: hypothetical protein GF416_04075 [Candidatus Altiarchaeales archaeon]|nr:hypothetical protein [Candidatus Altiarchaeales archaeon]MBD3416297.1 hypothetical protein [Candidatus Altiarchaeales archaeon]